MLGIGSGLTTFEKPFSPNDISNLVRWYKVNTGIIGEDGGTTAAGTMADAEEINAWQDQTRNANAVQATGEDQPHWEDDEPGAVKFDNTADMTFTAEEIGANTDFTIIFRLKPISFGTDVLLASDTNNFIRWHSNALIKVKIGGAGISSFEDGSNTISTSVYSTIMLVRSNGSTGNLNVYVKPSNASEIDWDSAENHTDTDPLIVSIIGAESDDSKSLDAYVKDVLIYNGTALDETQRTNMYSYLESQVY